MSSGGATPTAAVVELIKPAVGTAKGEVIVMSPVDCVMPRMPSGTVFLYRQSADAKSSKPIVSIDQLKSSLSQVLSLYPILAGSLRNRTDGGFEVELTNTGMGWIQAENSESYPLAESFAPETIPLPPGVELMYVSRLTSQPLSISEFPLRCCN